MTDVFISYSRQDSDFVRRLHEALKAAGRDSWVDWEGIPPTAEWMQEIHEAIEAADTFVAVLSPASASSEICRAEVAYAEAQGKRLVPLVARDVEPARTPDELARLNWLFFRPDDDFDAAFERLMAALDTDLDHLKVHTWLLVRCRRWTRGDEDASALLRGRELETAEAWLRQSVGREPAPTADQTRFVVESRRRETRRQRRLLVGVAIALVVSITLGVVAWLQRDRAIVAREEADRQRDLAVARSLATSSELALDQTGNGLVTSTLLAVESLRRVATAEGEAAWERDLRLLPPPPLIESEPLGEVTAGTFSGDGRFWAAGDASGAISLGKVADGSVSTRWPALDTAVLSLAFSPDSRWLAAGGQEQATVWEIATGNRLAAFDRDGTHLDTFGNIRSLAFARDGSRLYLAAEGYGVEVIAADTWRRLEPLPTPESRAFRLAVHPLRDLLVAGGFGLTLFDLATGLGQPVADARREEVDALAFSREGHELASSDLAVRVWDLEQGDDGEPLLVPADRLVAADDRVLSLAFSPGGSYLLVGREAGTAHLRTAKNGAEVNRMVEAAPVRAVGFDDEGRHLLTISDRFRAWRLPSGPEAYRVDLGSKIDRAFFVGDGRWLVSRTGSGLLSFFEPDSFEKDSFEPDSAAQRLTLDPGRGSTVVTSADGRWLAAAGKTLTLLDAGTLETRAELDSSGDRAQVAFSPDSRFLVLARRRAISVLDLASMGWRELESEPGQSVGAPEFSSDGHWLSVRVGDQTRLWRQPGWTPLATVQGDLLAGSPDGATICTRLPGRRGFHPPIDFAWQADSGLELGSVGLQAYQGKSTREYGAGDIALAEHCDDWPRVEKAKAAIPPGQSRRWRVETSDTELLLFPRLTEDRIAEACRRLPRQLTPAEWARYLPDEPYRPGCDTP